MLQLSIARVTLSTALLLDQVQNPLRAPAGVGYKLESELTAMGVRTANDLRAHRRDALVAKFGERVGAYLHSACRGDDPTPVQQSGPARSITVEDSFKSCTTLAAAAHVLRILAPDLLTRLREDHEVQSSSCL